jgi:hypothetical protein
MGDIGMKNTELIDKLLLFKDKAFCHHSHYKAGQIWREIKYYIPEPYNFKIFVEWSHVQLGHGFNQACLALDDEIKGFIKTIK